MPDDTSAIAGKPQDEAPSCPGPRFEVPEFMVPKSIAEVRELARMIALAEWAPDSYRDLDANYVQQKIELAIMHGATVGLGPVGAVQSIAVIDGMPTIWGDGALAIVERSGLLEDMIEVYEVDGDEGLSAICTMRRRRRPTAIQNRFSMAMAEQARLTRKEGPWQSYPQRMLKMRARSWTLRDGFADVLRGLHIREEVDDFIEIPERSSASAPDPVSFLRRPRRPIALRPAQAPSSVNAIRGPLESSDGGRDQPEATQGSKRGIVSAAPDIAGEPGEIGGDDSEADTAPSDPPREESYALVDADGCVTDVVGAEALRAEFQRLFIDKHLALDQVRRLWESNEPARAAIERVFGAAALLPAFERLLPAEAAREKQAAGPGGGQRANTGPVQNGASPPETPRALAWTGKRVAENPYAASDHCLRIEPGWGEQRVFRHYRAALIAIHNQNSGKASEIVRFREANAAVEARLRGKLPQWMTEIDAIFERGLRSE